MNVHYRAGGGEPGYIAPNGQGLDPNVLHTSSNRLWRATDGGDSRERLSDDLTRADPMTLGHSGGPVTGDMNGPEVYATIFAVGPGKVDIDVIWTGSDDGLVHVTRDGGESWKNVTPPDMPDFGRVSLIDASAFDAGKAYVSARLPLLDDFRPHVWRTEDYGETWTRIVDGIREDAYVNSVREDPNREGLLYAGTNHGVYVTFDDGGWWQELNPGLPDMPVTDVIPEHDELAMASHGRGFWVLDNVGPLRQYRPGILDEGIVMFDPAPAYRSANGVVLTYWLPRDSMEWDFGGASLEIRDEEGNVVRSFAPTLWEEEERDRSGPPLPMNKCWNRLRWDLRTDPATPFPGMILWGVRTMVPVEPPGKYHARLSLGESFAVTRRGEVRPDDAVEIEVRRNPWIEGVTAEDLVAQDEFGVRVRDEVDRANRAVIEIRRVTRELEERLEGVEDEGLRETAERLRVALEGIEGEIYQVRNRSNQDPLNFPIKVNNRSANPLSMSERGDGRPGKGMVEVCVGAELGEVSTEPRLEFDWQPLVRVGSLINLPPTPLLLTSETAHPHLLGSSRVMIPPSFDDSTHFSWKGRR